MEVNASARPIFDQNGVLIDAGCGPGGELQMAVKPQGGDHNLVDSTTFDNSTGSIGPVFASDEVGNNQKVNLVPENSTHSFNGLLAVRTFAGQMTTIQWFAMSADFSSQGACIFGGTVSF